MAGRGRDPNHRERWVAARIYSLRSAAAQAALALSADEGQPRLGWVIPPPWAEVEHIQATSADGQVVLRGLVENEQERVAVELAAQRIPGVVGVRNELAVAPKYASDELP